MRYVSLEQLKREAAIESLDVLDDAVAESILDDASRAVDIYCARQFFAAAASRAYTAPPDGSRTIWLRTDWWQIDNIINGDGSVVPASAWQALPLSGPPYDAVRLRDSAGLRWLSTNAGDYLGAITISGSTGYVQRSASTPEALRCIAATQRATLIVALALYRRRFGAGTDAATVTAAGIVLTPQGMPRDAAQLLEPYRLLP